MIEASKLEGKTMVCLKPCDTYSFNQLLKEHRVDREKAYIVGVGCKGKLDIEKIRKMGIKGIRGISGAEITGDAETLTVYLPVTHISAKSIVPDTFLTGDIQSEFCQLMK